MNILLPQGSHDEAHLRKVLSEMKQLGQPTIKMIWVECYDAWVALEGTHRLLAAYELGLLPIIEEIDYNDICDCNVNDPELCLDWDMEITIEELVASAVWGTWLKFEEE